VVSNKVLDNETQNYGYDARNDRYVDMVKEGIIDPTKVVRSALENAASVATLMLTSDALVADLPAKDEKKPAGGGYDDMYDCLVGLPFALARARNGKPLRRTYCHFIFHAFHTGCRLS